MSITQFRPWLLIAIVVALLSAAAPVAAAAERCGRVEIPTRGISAKVRVVRGHTPCRAARRQIAAAYHAEDTRHWAGYAHPWGVFWRVHGWRCSIGLGGSQTFCRRPHHEIDGSLRTDDGWSF